MTSFLKLASIENVQLNLKFSALSFRVHKGQLNEKFQIKPNRSVFGLVYEGQLQIESSVHKAQLGAGMYFACNSEWSISANAKIFLIECENFHVMNQFGGPYEKSGRLQYIDNCTDSLLVPPVKKGDPCLNMLYFSKNILQTTHTHPSFRVGMVLGGEGLCLTEDKKIPLKQNDFFYIPPNQQHSFSSHAEKGLVVLAFHPDSDFGPTDEVHPMINRTIL